MLHPERRRENVRQIAYEDGFHDGYAQALSEMPEIVLCKDCMYTRHCINTRDGIDIKGFCKWGVRKER